MPRTGQATATPPNNGGTGSIFVPDSGADLTTTTVWKVWNTSYQTNSTSAISTNDVWIVWNQTYGGTTASLTVPQIQAANTNTTATVGNHTIIWTNWVQAHNLTTEQLAEQARQIQAQNEASRQRQATLQAELTKAKDRAEKLLRESLDEKQKQDLSANGFFELDTIRPNGERRRYRIHRKWSGNIQQIDPSSGQRLKTLCIHPRESIPVEDSMLAQKLMLEGGMEDDLLRIANHS